MREVLYTLLVVKHLIITETDIILRIFKRTRKQHQTVLLLGKKYLFYYVIKHTTSPININIKFTKLKHKIFQ